MKIYFAGSLTDEIAWIRRIYQIIEDLGYVHTSDFMNTVDVSDFTNASKVVLKNSYKQARNDILKADVCCFEVTVHCLAIGQLLQFALDNRKPVIALYRNNKPLLLDGVEEEDQRLIMLHYNKNDFKEEIKATIGFQKELIDKRFTMILPSKMDGYLEKLAEKRGSKSGYIRELIRKEMEKKD
jgi:hypothetical protein